MSHGLYDHYVEFKNWSEVPQESGTPTFATLVDSTGKQGKLDLLEIGFGDGSLMDWARGAGHRITGIEIIPELVEMVRARNHEAYLTGDALLGDVKFDVIIAVDVLEHLTLEQFSAFFSLADRVLKSDGVVVGRFPNGDSPFFGRYQYGDYTHDKPLSWRSLHQIAVPHGFEVKKALNPRPLPRSFNSRLKQKLAYLVRDLTETILGFAYLGYRTPMDPNIIAVLGRASRR